MNFKKPKHIVITWFKSSCLYTGLLLKLFGEKKNQLWSCSAFWRIISSTLCSHWEWSTHFFIRHFCPFSDLYCSKAQLSQCLSPSFKQFPYVGGCLLSREFTTALSGLLVPLSSFDTISLHAIPNSTEMSNWVIISMHLPIFFTWQRGEIHYCHLFKWILSL